MEPQNPSLEPENAPVAGNESAPVKDEPIVSNPEGAPVEVTDVAAEATETVEIQAETPEVAAEAAEEAPAKAEEAPAEAPAEAEEAPAEAEAPAEEAEEKPAARIFASREEVVDHIADLIDKGDVDLNAEDISHLKQQFYQLHNNILALQREAFVADGGDPEKFTPVTDEVEEQFKAALNTLREKKAEARRQLEIEMAENLRRKRAIVAELIEMSNDTDNVNRHFNRAKDLQTEFQAIGKVPETENTALWKDYQAAREKFYDQLKVNKDLRDYDFRKNLEAKEKLIADATELLKEEDVVTAFRRLQDLHEQWRQTGPVEKDLREDIWNRFKEVSAEINKRYQAHFEERKAKEAENEAAKTAICEEVEALNFAELATYAAWDEMTAKFMDAQARWKVLGFASRKSNNALFARFREACDKFFTAKAAFFKSMKDTLNDNLAKKTALVEQAEALKDSTDWRKTSDALVALQKEWKTIGPVPKKHSEALWTRFLGACDHFFEQKKQNTSGVRHTEQANLKLKQEIIDRLAEITAPDAPSMSREEAAKTLSDLRNQWQEIGHVPFKMKDAIYDSYRQLLRQAENKFDVRGGRQRRADFEASAAEMEGDDNKISRERDRLFRALEARRSELKTFENNFCFLSSSSKSGNSLLKEMERRMEAAKEEIRDLEEKINLLNSKLSK